MWRLTPGELEALYKGATRARRRENERAVFAAYQTVIFHALAKAGELKAWPTYRADMFGDVAAPAEQTAVDSMAIKERRRQQMEHFRKHQQARNTPVRRARG